MNYENFINEFNKKGYFILSGVFESKDCEKIISEANKIKEKDNNYLPLMNPHKNSNSIMGAMGNKIIIRFIESYFKNEVYGLQTEFFFMPPHTKGFTPHQDNTYVQADENSFVSAWVALTDVNEKNGGLIIWPMSHKEKKLQSLENIEEKSFNQDPNARSRITILPDSYKKITPSIKKGDVIMIHSWLVHASNDNNSKANRYALLCTYLKKDANFRPGNTAKRKPFRLISNL